MQFKKNYFLTNKLRCFDLGIVFHRILNEVSDAEGITG